MPLTLGNATVALSGKQALSMTLSPLYLTCRVFSLCYLAQTQFMFMLYTDSETGVEEPSSV